MMTGQTSQFDPDAGLDSYKSLSFDLLPGADEEISRLPVEVKNLTTVGVILEILPPDNGVIIDHLKGREGFLKIIAHDNRVMIEVPGKILWTRNRDGDAGATLGLELLGPLPLPVRHMLEANMAIGAKDIKILWDYWDEIQEAAAPVDLPGPVRPVAAPPEPVSVGEARGDTGSHDNWLYWTGFAAIVAGLAMQFPQSEYLGFSGLIVMFFGSLMVAWKSILSMRRLAASGPAD